MQSLKTAMAGVFAFALMLPASIAWAGNGEEFDRPDLMDVHEEGDVRDGQIGNWVGFADDNNPDNQMAIEWSWAYGGYSAQVGNYQADRDTYNGTNTYPTGYIYRTATDEGEKTWYWTDWAEGEYTVKWTWTDWDYYNYASDFSFAEVRWILAQPDKIQINHRKKKIRQKDYVGFVAVLEDHLGESERVAGDWSSDVLDLYYYGSIAGCRGNVKAKDTNPDPVRANADAENCADHAKWKIRCAQDLRTILGQLQRPGPPRRGGGALMTEATVERFLTLLGLTGTETVIRGVDTGNVCDPAADDNND
jgi:hypothetical protein